MDAREQFVQRFVLLFAVVLVPLTGCVREPSTNASASLADQKMCTDAAKSSQQDKDRIAQLERQNTQQEKQLRALTAAMAEKSRDSHSVVPENEVYTLYRSSDFGADIRVHVGTFDTRSFSDPAENKQYNYEMCSDAQLNFNERNSGRPIRFWCEEGRFKEKLP